MTELETTRSDKAMNRLTEGECVELMALTALVFHDAVVMQACNQQRAAQGYSMAYSEGNLLMDNAERLQARLKELIGAE